MGEKLLPETFETQNVASFDFPAFSKLSPGDTTRLLVESGKLLARCLDPVNVYEVLRHVATSVIGCDGLVVSSFSAETKLIRCMYALVDGAELDVAIFPPVTFNPEPDSGMQSEVIRTGEAKLFGDVSRRVEEGKGKFFQVSASGNRLEDLPKGSKPKCQSAIMAPIKLDDEVIGVVQLMADEEGVYGQEQLVFVEGLALQVAAALRNAELFGQMQNEISERIKTERMLREREEEVRNLNMELEQRVGDRSSDLNRAIAELESFCYSVSHDLRQPLRGICSAAMMLLYDHDQELSSEAKGHLQSLANLQIG